MLGHPTIKLQEVGYEEQGSFREWFVKATSTAPLWKRLLFWKGLNLSSLYMDVRFVSGKNSWCYRGAWGAMQNESGGIEVGQTQAILLAVETNGLLYPEGDLTITGIGKPCIIEAVLRSADGKELQRRVGRIT